MDIKLSLSLYLEQYNDYANKFGFQKVTQLEIEKKIKETIGDAEHNLYDTIEKLYPSIKKFNKNNMYKVYGDGEQLCVRKDFLCVICNKSFEMCCMMTHVNGNMVHYPCTISNNDLIVKKMIEEKLRNDNFCKICNVMFTADNIPIMTDNGFYHQQCCKNQVRKDFSDLTCVICNKHINHTESGLEYCIRNDQTYHVVCAKNTHKSLQFKKIKINMSFNRCSICRLCIIEDTYEHVICENELKRLDA